jgi:hypothetical protein
MDDILIHTERGIWEVTTEDWGKLKGYPAAWGTTVKYRWWIIFEPRLHFWYVLGDVLAPTLGQEVEDCCCENEDEDEDSDLVGMPLLSTRQRWGFFR